MTANSLPSLARTDTVPTIPTAPVAPARRRDIPRVLAGLAIIATPPLFVAGLVTVPPQEATDDASYVASLIVDPALTSLSASLLHYAWVAFALGLLATIALAPSGRGRILTAVGAVGATLGAIQMSGLLLSDWFVMSAGQVSGIDEAVAVQAGAMDASVAVWVISARALLTLGIPVLTIGLARAGKLSWWLVPLSILPLTIILFVPGVVGALVSIVGWVPVIAAGVRVIREA